MAEFEAKLSKEQKYLASRRKDAGKQLEQIADFRSMAGDICSQADQDLLSAVKTL